MIMSRTVLEAAISSNSLGEQGLDIFIYNLFKIILSLVIVSITTIFYMLCGSGGVC